MWIITAALNNIERHELLSGKTALGVHIKSMASHDWILQFTYQFNSRSPVPSDHFCYLAAMVKCASLKTFLILRNHAPCAIFIIKIRSICMSLISTISHRGSLFWQQLSEDSWKWFAVLHVQSWWIDALPRCRDINNYFTSDKQFMKYKWLASFPWNAAYSVVWSWEACIIPSEKSWWCVQ